MHLKFLFILYFKILSSHLNGQGLCRPVPHGSVFRVNVFAAEAAHGMWNRRICLGPECSPGWKRSIQARAGPPAFCRRSRGSARPSRIPHAPYHTHAHHAAAAETMLKFSHVVSQQPSRRPNNQCLGSSLTDTKNQDHPANVRANLRGADIRTALCKDVYLNVRSTNDCLIIIGPVGLPRVPWTRKCALFEWPKYASLACAGYRHRFSWAC